MNAELNDTIATIRDYVHNNDLGMDAKDTCYVINKAAFDNLIVSLMVK